MKKKNKELDFSNQLISVGIDVHKRNWSVTIQIAGQQVKNFIMDPNPEKLIKHLHTNYPGGIYQSVYEAGFCGYWIDRQLQSQGIKNIIVNPADVPTSNKEKTRKTDTVLDFLGVHLPEDIELKHWSGGFISYLQKLGFKYDVVKQTLEQLIIELSNLRKQLTEVLKWNIWKYYSIPILQPAWRQTGFPRVA